MQPAPEVSKLIKETKNKDVNIYLLNVIIPYNEIYINNNQLSYVSDCKTFLCYIRNILPSISYSAIWNEISYLFPYDDIDRYIDKIPSLDDIKFVKKVTTSFPNIINNLRGFKLSEQISILKNLFEKFNHDLSIPLAILEKQKIDPNTTLDDQTCLLLELSVRVEIVKNNYNLSKLDEEKSQVHIPLSSNSDFFDFYKNSTFSLV